MWLLLAEDEPAMAEAITAFLQYHQYTVDWVDNGVDAYDQASHWRTSWPSIWNPWIRRS